MSAHRLLADSDALLEQMPTREVPPWGTSFASSANGAAKSPAVGSPPRDRPSSRVLRRSRLYAIAVAGLSLTEGVSHELSVTA